MGLLDEELKEIREMIKHFRAGKVSVEQVNSTVALWSQSEKRQRLVVSMLGMAAKHGKKHLTRMVNKNLIGAGTVIDLSPGEIEDEKVLCPINDRHVTRGWCLDYSGDAAHEDDCKGCDAGIECKKLLLGTPMYTV